MNSPNLQPRQFIHNTCELSIDDKKSPFPAWMKFNKPNPLRFSLSVQDPDRPELEPMRVSGDRNKLEELNQTVEEYVKKLLVSAPLPQLNDGEDQDKLPRTSMGGALESGAINRPIDALKVTDDQPRIEADGLSRHLFYLGNGADANTTVMSLSTLQLFDLSSALNEGLTPVAIEEPEPSAAFSATNDSAIEPVVIPAESVTNNNTNVVNPMKTDVQEPKVVLPSVNETNSINSSDLYGLETDSSILERSTTTRDRFKKPKPSLGSLNLPELPDFSRSPLTSIPLWLGLGGMASLIIAFPFLSSTFKGNSVAKKPVAPATQVASNSDAPPEYQPTTPSLPTGVGTPSLNGLPNNGSPLGGTVGSLPPGAPAVLPGGNQYSSSAGGYGTSVPGVGSPTTVTAPNNKDLARQQRAAALQRQQDSAKNGVGAETPAKNPASPTNPAKTRGAADDGGVSTQARNPAFNPNLRPPAIEDDPRLKPPGQQTSNLTKPRGRQNPVAENNNSDGDPAIIGQAGEFNGNESGFFKPVSPQTRDNPSDLTAPSATQVESAQTRGVQEYFKARWKEDRNFDESLQYRVNVAKNGQVLSVEGQTEKSRVYLNKTSFLKPGVVVTKSGQQDQRVWLILHPSGDVQALTDGE
jgi:Domain of unknown function (DUF4335)